MRSALTIVVLIGGLWFFSLLSAADSLRIPIEGELVINDPITIASDLRVQGPGRLVIQGAGSITIAAGEVTISGIEIEWRAPAGAPNPAIIQSGGNLVLTGNRIAFDVPPLSAAPATTGAQWFLRVDARASKGSLTVTGNQVTSRTRFGAGFLYAWRLDNFAPVKVSGNDLTNVHGGIYLADVRNAEISDNRLTQVSFGNIVLSDALNTTVAGNYLLVPGGGTSGDGMTIAGGADNVVRRNTLMFGTCYGILVLPGSTGVRRMVIEDNTILGGITSALAIRGEKAKPAQSIAVRRNLLSENQGWAISAEFLSGLTFEDNVVSGNAERGGFQHIFGDVSVTSWRGNTKVRPYTEETRAGPSFRPAEEYLLR